MPQIGLFHYVGGQLRTDLKCTACDLCSNTALRTNCMDGFGALSPVYAIIGHAPGYEDDGIGRPMTGANGRLLRELLMESGIDPTDCFFSNALRCCLHSTEPTQRHWKACKDYLLRDIAERNPKVLIACGAQSLEWLTGQKQVRKLRKRGLPCILQFPDGETRLVFPIQQPAAIFHANGSERDSLRMDMVEDLRWIREQLETDNLHRGGDIAVNYRVAKTPEHVDEIFHELWQHDELATDLETGDLSWEPMLFPEATGRIVAAGFSFGNGVARAIPLYAKGSSTFMYWPEDYIEKELVPRLRELYRAKRVFGHNFISFDQKWLRAKLGVQNCNIVFDTMYGHYLLDEERGTHGLERLALMHTTLPPWKATFSLQDTDALCFYLCRDVDATWRLREIFSRQLNKMQTWLLEQLIMPCANVLTDLEYAGVRVGHENLGKLEAVLDEKISSEIKKLRAFAPVKAYEVSQNRTFNFASPQQVGDLLTNYMHLSLPRTKASKQAGTGKKALEKHKKNPVVSTIFSIRGLEKLRGTYCAGIRKALLEDGRLHTSYKMHGTVTGRPSSSDPNLMNIPRPDTVKKVLEDGSLIKSLFIPDAEDELFLEADYSQVELRVLAAFSGDPALRRIYLEGLDAHTATAAEVFGIPMDQVTDAQRTAAKKTNFGVVYGMTKETLLAEFVAAGNTQEAAERFYAQHQIRFAGVWAFMAAQEAQIRKHKVQETPFGRQRRYSIVTEDAIRQAYNFPIQSTASDLTELSLIRIHHAIKELNLPARIVLTVYDSILLSVNKAYIMQVAIAVKHLMESLSFDWLTVPIKADLKVGKDWGHLEKYTVSSE